MLPRRLLFGILILLGLMAAGVAVAWQMGRHQPTYYNCLYLSSVQVQLNRRLSPIRFFGVSPDGKDVLGGIQQRGSLLIFIENIRTGRRSPIQKVPFIQSETVQWFAEGEKVYYGWYEKKGFHASLFYRQEQRIVNLNLDSFYWLGHFSADEKYVVLWTSHNNRGMVLSLEDHPPTINHIGRAHQWSPTGKHVAYFSDSYLVVADLEQGTTAQTILPQLDSIGQFAGIPIRWSADEHYLSVETHDTEPPFIDVFSIEGDTPTLIAETQPEPGRDTRWTTYTAYWPQNERQFGYIIRTGRSAYELWSFDLETKQRQLVIPESELKDYLYDGYQIVTLREEGDSMFLEYRDTDVITPRYTHRFQNSENVACGWRWSNIVQCSGLVEDPGLIWLDENGTIWPTDLPANTRVEYFNNYTSEFSPFGTLLLRQGDHLWFEIVNFETRQTYQVPEWVTTDALSRNARSFDLSPWPDDPQSWLVRFSLDVQYRFWPAQNAWELAEPPHPLGLRSPDGERVAIIRYTHIPGLADLIVQETDGSKQWNLGSFPTYMLTGGMRWTQCGDILAPLRDDLAAEKP